MVEYTMQEILCYNSLLDGKKIQGLRIEFSPMIMQQTIINDVLKQLKEEQLVDELGKLTVAGEAKLHIIRTYKKAETYLCINNIAISFQKDRRMIMAVQNNEGKILFETGDRAGVVIGLMKEYPFLKDKDKNQKEDKISSILSEKQWDELEERIKVRNIILLQKYEQNNMTENEAVFFYENKCFEYHMEKKELVERKPSELRKRIMELLELEGN